MAADLASYIDKLDLGKHREFLLGIARPSVEIVTTNIPITNGCSKFGGSPDVPSDFKWPDHMHGLYRFIGQVNLGDIPKGPHGLPASSLLSFFYAHDEEGKSFWGDLDYVRVFRFENVGSLKPAEPPPAIRLGSTCTVKLQLGADLPEWTWWDESAMKRWPIDESQQDAYLDLRGRLHPSNRYLLGYPFNSTLAYDPTPGPEWRSLLTLSSDDELKWCWNDGDWLVTFIEQQRLQVGDFSHVKADAG